MRPTPPAGRRFRRRAAVARGRPVLAVANEAPAPFRSGPPRPQGRSGELNATRRRLAPVRIDPAQIDPLLANRVVGARDAIGSGYTADGIAHYGAREQGEHFIQKPFTGHDRASKTRAVLDQG